MPEDWGREGVELYLMRKRIQFSNFHWGVFIQCKKYKSLIVVNRHEGLSITKVENIEDAIKETKGFNAEFSLDFKESTNFQQKLFAGYNKLKQTFDRSHETIETKNKWRLEDGPLNFEYQSLGIVEIDQLKNLFLDYVPLEKIQPFYEYLINEIKKIRKIEHPKKDNYNFLTNNCQHFAEDLIKMFKLNHNILFLNDTSLGRFSWTRYSKNVEWRDSKENCECGDPTRSDFVVEKK